jgi:hypothetical protein
MKGTYDMRKLICNTPALYERYKDIIDGAVAMAWRKSTEYGFGGFIVGCSRNTMRDWVNRFSINFWMSQSAIRYSLLHSGVFNHWMNGQYHCFAPKQAHLCQDNLYHHHTDYYDTGANLFPKNVVLVCKICGRKFIAKQEYDPSISFDDLGVSNK